PIRSTVLGCARRKALAGMPFWRHTWQPMVQPSARPSRRQTAEPGRQRPIGCASARLLRLLTQPSTMSSSIQLSCLDVFCLRQKLATRYFIFILYFVFALVERKNEIHWDFRLLVILT